jgi:hypothetical protein
MLYAFLISPMLATSLTHLIFLDSRSLIIVIHELFNNTVWTADVIQGQISVQYHSELGGMW